MVDLAFYLVSEDIARRCGLIGQRYRVGYRYILDNKDLSRIRLTSDEFVNGLQGIEKISSEEAKRLIAQGGYNMSGTGDNGVSQAIEVPTSEPENNEPATEEEAPSAEESEEEVIDGEDVGDANDILGEGSEEENENNEPKEEEE